MDPQKTIIITGGGTGGHVFPAISLGKEFARRGYNITYIGSDRGMEAKLVPTEGFKLLVVKTGAVKNQKVTKIILSLFQLFRSTLWAIRLLRKEKPRAVVGVGGYISFPASVAAFLCRIPLFLQEQNVSVGIANRALGKIAKRVFLGFEEAAAYFPKNKCVTTGNPLRRVFFESEIPPYDPNGKTIVIVGGSLGAHAVNEAICQLLTKIQSEFPSVRILHQTGQNDYDEVRALYKKNFRGTADVIRFIENMPNAYGRASLVICRSGALTVSELIQVGRPAIFVPYPRKGQNDQTANADLLKNQGCAEVVEQGENFNARLWTAISSTFRPASLKKMSENYAKLRKPDATASIVDHIEKELSI